MPAGLNDIVVAGGMESMSQIPHYMPKVGQTHTLQVRALLLFSCAIASNIEGTEGTESEMALIFLLYLYLNNQCNYQLSRRMTSPNLAPRCDLYVSSYWE